MQVMSVIIMSDNVYCLLLVEEQITLSILSILGVLVDFSENCPETHLFLLYFFIAEVIGLWFSDYKSLSRKQVHIEGLEISSCQVP